MILLNIKFNPESFFMLFIAGSLDIVGVLLVLAGLDDFGMTDMIGIAFINGWLIMKGGKVINQQGRRGQMNSIKKLFTGKTTRLIIPTIAELIPYLGCLPFWTITVLFNLSED